MNSPALNCEHFKARKILSPNHMNYHGQRFQNSEGSSHNQRSESQKQGLLLEKYKQQIALLDTCKKHALLQRFNERQYDFRHMSDVPLHDGVHVNSFPNDAPFSHPPTSVDMGGNIVNSANNHNSRNCIDSAVNQNNMPNIKDNFLERFKQMSMEDTLQRRTLAVQESIRQTLAASYKNKEELCENAFINAGLQNCSPDFNIVDVLADPRWSGMRNGNRLDMRDDNKRRDGKMVFIFQYLSSCFSAIKTHETWSRRPTTVRVPLLL